jgi:hypothetical protein
MEATRRRATALATCNTILKRVYFEALAFERAQGFTSYPSFFLFKRKNLVKAEHE